MHIPRTEVVLIHAVNEGKGRGVIWGGAGGTYSAGTSNEVLNKITGFRVVGLE